jgi:hypothetical protein
MFPQVFLQTIFACIRLHWRSLASIRGSSALYLRRTPVRRYKTLRNKKQEQIVALNV